MDSGPRYVPTSTPSKSIQEDWLLETVSYLYYLQVDNDSHRVHKSPD
jgi:hypothetical protein